MHLEFGDETAYNSCVYYFFLLEFYMLDHDFIRGTEKSDEQKYADLCVYH